MTGTLPQEVRDVFSRFITTEFVTMDASGQPIAWPLTPYYTDGAPVIEVTTGVGYPKKAEDARRNPRVAMLFSDPTGSGIESGIRVLVQGTAKIDDADLGANRERYRRESAEKLPATVEMMPPKLVEGLFSWYYERIYIRVRPERIFVWREARERAAGTRLPHGGGSLRPHRGAAATSRGPARGRAGLRRSGSRSWGIAIRPRLSPGSRPTASRWRPAPGSAGRAASGE